jgi:hypothetical protein
MGRSSGAGAAKRRAGADQFADRLGERRRGDRERGKSQGRELASRIGVILVHLMNLQASPTTEPQACWRETIIGQRNEIERLIEDSPSLRQAVDGIIAKGIRGAAYQASTAITDRGEMPRFDPNTVSYAAEQVLGDWFPD